MAPNKKKKKTAVNPARGVATTSTVSKSKVADINVLDEETIKLAATAVENKQDVDPVQNGAVEREKELSELTPEQLEAQLEESELQLFLEKYGTKVRKESSRHVSRLETERRLFRSQTEYLKVGSWIPEELAQMILDHIESQNSHGDPHSAYIESQNGTNSALDDLVVKIWTLKRALEGLGFLEHPVKEGIAWLLRSLRSIERDSTLSGKEGLWGLEQCLDYLAATCDINDLPGYDSHQVPSKARELQEAKTSLGIHSNNGKIYSLLAGMVRPEDLWERLNI